MRTRSSVVFDGPERAFARAYMKGIGFDDDDLSRPTVGIANTWIEAMPCNFHLRGLAEHVKEGVRAAGGTPLEFNTIAISDGITMGTQGMKTSLVSREVIADSIELTARGYQFDAVIALSGCDKTIPGCVMALARLDVPSLMLYGGSILPGRWRGKDVTIQDVFEAIGKHTTGEMSDDDLYELEGCASPGAGRLRRAVHREHDGLRLRGDGNQPDGNQHGAGRRRSPRAGRARMRRACHAGSCRRSATEPGDHQGLPRERDRDRLHVRWLDQRRAPPARRRQRGRHRVDHRRLRPDLRADAPAG